MPNSKTTPETQIRALLAREEGPTLEFKAEVHRIDDENEGTKSQQKDELIKDVIALANGNTIYAGEIAYLVFGAANKKSENDQREIFDVGAHNINASRILSIVNSACDPRIENIECQEVTLDGKRLLLVTIPPSPYLHETARILRPSPKTSFSERTAFIRREQSIGVASQQERETIAQIKRYSFDEKCNPPGHTFGALLGGFVGGVLAYGFARNRDKLSPEPDQKAPKGALTGLVGALFGGFMGWIWGITYRNLYEIRSFWHKAPLHVRLLQMIASFTTSAILVRAAGYILSRIFPRPKS